MKNITRDTGIIDAEFRVVRPKWNGPNSKGDHRLAVALGIVAGAALAVGYAIDNLAGGFFVAIAAATLAISLYPQHRGQLVAGVALLLAFWLTGCGADQVATTDRPVEPTAAEIQRNEADAMRYRDPRQGWEPKPLLMPGAHDAAVHEVPHEAE